MSHVFDFGRPTQVVHVGDTQLVQFRVSGFVQPAQLRRAKQYTGADRGSVHGSQPADVAVVERAADIEVAVDRRDGHPIRLTGAVEERVASFASNGYICVVRHRSCRMGGARSYSGK